MTTDKNAPDSPTRVTRRKGIINGKSISVSVALIRGADVFLEHEAEDIFVVIPGNPGIAQFYIEFAEEMTKQNDAAAVCLGFAGHDTNQQGVFSVGEQIHFIESLVKQITAANPTSKLHFYGHSVGSYVAVNAAGRSSISDSVKSIYCLYPTVEHIAKAENARIWPLLLPGMRHVVAAFAGLVGLLPLSVRKSIAGKFANTSDKSHLEVVAKMTSFMLIRNVLFMALTEFEEIKEIDIHPSVLDKCTFFYGQSDGWVPRHYKDNMEKYVKETSSKPLGSTLNCPKPRVLRDPTAAPHAFVLSHSKQVAELVKHDV